MTDDDLKKISNLLDQKLDEKLEPIHHKIDALTADVIDLQDTAKAVWDKFSLVETKQERDIDEIKEHLGLPTQNN